MNPSSCHILPVHCRSVNGLKKMSFTSEAYTILYLTDGQCRISCTGAEHTYLCGDLCLLSPGTPCTLSAEGSYQFVSLRLDSAFVAQNLSPGCLFFCDSVRYPQHDYTVLRDLIPRISVKYAESSGENYLTLQELLFRLLTVLKENYMWDCLNTEIPEHYQNRIRKILAYIRVHYSEHITLSSLAADLYLTPQYLSSFLKKYLQKSFRQLLNEIRLNSACQELCLSRCSITQIAILCGFSSTAYFSRSFQKKYGLSPSDYRKQMHAETTPETTVKSFSSEERTDLFQKNTDTFCSTDIMPVTYRHSITASVKDGTDSPNNFCTLINTGYIHNLLLMDFQKDLLTAKTELGIRCIRLQGLLSSSFVPKTSTGDSYYFHNLDTALLFLYKNNFTPVFELSAMPHNANLFFPDEKSYYIRNIHFFERLEGILRHCSQLFQTHWLKTWQFELWMTPVDTISSYTESFIQIQELINRFLPAAILGGPGFSNGQWGNRLSEVLLSLKTGGFCPDFLSLHYSLETLTEDHTVKLHINNDYLLQETETYTREFRQYFPDTPVYLTEWTSAFHTKIPLHYSCFQSAFICHTLLLLQPFFAAAGYWIFSGSLPASVDRPSSDTLWSCGLLDRNKLKTPAYHVFALLRTLGTTCLKRGRNYYIVRKEKDHFQILAFNYAAPVSGEILESQKDKSFASIYQLFENTEVRHMEFILTDITPGTYRITGNILDRSHGSVLDILISGFRQGSLEEGEYLMNILLPTVDDISYYRNSCIPEKQTAYIKTGTRLSLSVDLSPHTVYLLDITRMYS